MADGGAPAARRRSSLAARLPQALLSGSIQVYRMSFAGFTRGHCRHEPSCSAYGLEALAVNGAWRGFWLTLSRVLRCGPWGSAGFDPVPDISGERHPFAPWRYGRWRLSSAPHPAAQAAAKGASKAP